MAFRSVRPTAAKEETRLRLSLAEPEAIGRSALCATNDEVLCLVCNYKLECSSSPHINIARA